MADTQIRLATRNDFDAICRLYVEFHEFHVREVPDRLRTLGDRDEYDNSALVDSLTHILDDADAALWVAEIDGKPVGFAHVEVREDEPTPATMAYRYGHLQSLMVSAASRHQGLGTQLVAAAEQWARQHGAVEMRLDTWEFSAGPLPFYDQLGYRTLRRTLARVFDAHG